MNFSTLLNETKALIGKHCLTPKPTIVIGLSGGPDSVFLLLLLKELAQQGHITLIAAHLNHGWRNNAHEDQNFCQELCIKHDITYVTEHAKNIPISVKDTGSREEHARRLRRHFLETTLQQHHGSLIALAHHRQDQQETFFVRLLRGSSLAGLRCMDSINAPYFRPLLQINKTEILAYLASQSQNYCTDQTNESDDYLRNRVRKYIIPAFNTTDNRFDQKFESTLRYLKAEDDFLKSLTQQHCESLFSTDQTPNKGSLLYFKQLSHQEQKRVLIYWLVQEHATFTPSNNLLDEICRFLTSPRGGTHRLCASWSLIKQSKFFWLEKHQ